MQNALRFVKKAASIATVATTIAWSLGVASLPVVTHAATPGSLIKMAGNPAVYYLHTDNKRYVFPNQPTYNSWYPDFSGVQTISQSELQSYAIGGNVTLRPGTKLAKITTDPKVYAIEPGGSLRWVQTEAIAKALYGDNWASRVVDVPDAFFVNYKPGADLTTATYPTGTLIKQANSADIYYVDGSSKRHVLPSGLTANRLNAANAVTASDSTFNALTGGADVSAQDPAIWSIVVGASTSTGTGLSVALASDSPSSGILPTGSALNTVLKLNLTASSDGSVNVTGINVNRSGFSVDTDVAGLGVYDAQGARHGNVVTLSQNSAVIPFSDDPIIVAAGTTVPVFVKANISTTGNTSGTMQFSIPSGGVTTSATVNGTFPMTGGVFGLTNGSLSLGALDVDSVTVSTSAQTVDIGTTDKVVGKFKLSESSSREDIKITRMRFFNNGNAADTDIKNIKLIETSSGTVLGTLDQLTNRYANFNMNYTLPEGTNKTVEVHVDVVNGSTRTVQFVLQNDYDIDVQGLSTGANILPTHTAGVDTSTGFPVGDNTTTYNSISINQGTLTVAKDSSSLSGNIGQGQNSVKFATFKLQALGEDIQLQKILIDFGTNSVLACESDSPIDCLSGTVRAQINGTTIYSVTNSSASIWGTPAQETVSSNYVIKAGTTALLDIVGDVNSSHALNGETFDVGVGTIYYKRLSTNNFDTASNAVLITGNTLTVTTASLSASPNTAFANQTQVAGASGLKIGSYVFQAGTAEGVNLTSLAVSMSSVTGLTNLRLMNGTTQLGSTIASPSSGSANNFSFSLQVPVSGTATIDVLADSSTTATTVTTSLAASAVGASGQSSGTTISNVPATTVTGQTITISGGGTLAITADSATPSQAVLHTNETGVNLLTVRLSATGENVNVTKLVFETANGSGNYQSVELDNGTTQVGAPVSLVNGLATFAGLNLSVPKDSALTLSLKAGTTDTGTMVSNTYTAFSVADMQATGAASGSQIYPLTLSTTASAGTPVVGGASVTVASTLGFSVGDAVIAYNATDGVEWGMITAIGSSTAMTVAVENSMTAAASRITRMPTVVTTAASAGTPLVGGASVTVTSTKGFAVGDAVLAYNTTDGTELGIVTAIASPTAMTVAVKTNMTAAASRVSKISSGATTTASAGTPLVGGVAVTVNSTVGFAVGDAVFAYNSTDGVELGMVTAVGSTTLTIGTENNMTAAASRVTKLATFKTTAASAGTPLVAGVSTTVTSSAGFSTGDPVLAYNTTDGVEMSIATAVADSTHVTVAPTTNMTAAVSRESRLWSLTSTSNPFVVQDVEPIIALNASSPSGSSSGAANQAVARFNITAAGYRDLTVKYIKLTRGGNIGANVATSAVPKIYINGDLKGTGASWSGTTSGSTSLVTLTSPFTISAGTTATFEVQVDTSAAVATNTFQVYIDGTAGVEQGSNNGLGWYYDVPASSPGLTTAPTNASPATIADTYPVYGNTLTY